MTSPTGATAAQQRNRDAVEALESQASTSVRAAIAAMLAEVLADVGDLDDDTAPPTVENVAARARAAWNRLVAGVIDWVRDTFTRLVTRAVANVPDDTAPDLPPRTVEQRVATLTDQIRAGLDQVPDVVASRVVTELRDGYQQGESPQQLRRRVADVLGRDEWDAEAARIARTTTTSVYNAAHAAAADALELELGRPLRRLWLATRDTRTRPTHREANGQVIDPGEMFKVGDARLRFPGDPLGPVEEIVNCRCVVVPVVADVVVDLAHRVTGREAAVLDDADIDDMPMAAAGLVAALLAVTNMPPQFVTYWTVGEGGRDIRWGTDRDMTRCMRALRRYLGPDQLGGACANLHHLMTGKWPAEDAAAEEGADMPCPCENATEEEIAAAAAITATVTGDPDLPIGDREAEWDGDAAADRVRAWATPDGAEMVDAEQYARAFFYRDPAGEPETEAAYKLGFADVVDGELTAIPAGVFAVASVLEGGRGGVDIPAEDTDAVRDRVSAYYARMAEAWDDPDVMAPWDRTDPDAEPAADTPDDEDMAAAARYGITAADLEEARTMGMIALIPSEQDAARLAVDGDTAIPPEELHVTLAFLGPGADWIDTPEGARVTELAQAIAADVGPITGRIWAVAAANPDSDEPAAVYLVGDDTGRLAELAGGIHMAAADIIPPQHSPWVAHISTAYGTADLSAMTASGTDVVLDRIRVAFGGNVVDFPLSGDDTLDLDDDEADEPAEDMPVDPDDMVENETAVAPVAVAASSNAPAPTIAPPAGGLRLVNLAAASENAAVVAEAATNAPEAPPGAWLVPVVVDGPTPPTVTAQGRVWGHIGQAEVCHVGIKDECVTIPPTRTGYGAFHRDQVTTAEGDTVQVGYLYTGCDHSDLNLSIDEARDYLDASCTRTAVGRVYDTEHGPMFVGAVVPGATAANVAALHRLSGEWFTAPLELHAAVGVDAAGFPVDGTGEEIRVSDVEPEPAAEQIAATADPFTTPEVVAGLVAAHRKRAAMRAAEPAVVAARQKRAARAVAGYEKRGA